MTKSAEILRNEFWESDRKNGSIIRSQYDEIKRVLNSCDIDWVKEQYFVIKAHAIKNTNYYSNYSVNDVFPVVNKTFLIENKENCTAKTDFKTPLHISSTSGSTGIPFTVVQDYKKRNRNIADLKVFGELCNYPSHERMVFFRVKSDKLIRTVEQEDRENIYYIDSSNLSDENIKLMLDVLLKKKPRIVFSYPSTLKELAKYVTNHRSEFNKFSMVSVLGAGEGMSNEDRKLIEQAFSCKVYRRYSDMELGILAQDNGDGGSYYLNWGSYYFECLKLNYDEPAEDGEIGRIVITDLFNYAFPMIRYDTGDLGRMKHFEDGRLPQLEEIFGRKRDFVYAVNGDLISPSKISVLMWGIKGIAQWQFIQKTKDEYLFKLCGDESTDITPLVNKVKTVLGDKANIEIVFVDEIPVESSNKRRAVICEYQKGG